MNFFIRSIVFFIFVLSTKALPVPFLDKQSYMNEVKPQQGIRQAQFASIGYDIVYVRCPRGNEPVLRPNSSGGVQELNSIGNMFVGRIDSISNREQI